MTDLPDEVLAALAAEPTFLANPDAEPFGKDAPAAPQTECVTAFQIDSDPADFADLVGKQVGIRVGGTAPQSTVLVCVAPGEEGGTMLSVSPALVAPRSDGPRRYSLERIRRRHV